MRLFLNELSMAHPAPDRAAARDLLVALQKTLHAAALRKLPTVLHTHRDFWQTPLAEGYTFADWQRDPSVERERAQRLRSAAGKAPFLEELHDDADAVRGGLTEALWEGRAGLGIGLATMHDAPVLSLPVTSFAVDPLPVLVRFVDDQGSTESNEAVCNLHSPASVERRAVWIAMRQQQELASGAEVVRRREELLERLDLTATATGQLLGLRGTEKTFPFVLRHLFALNERARAWDGASPFPEGYPFPCSEESESTLAQLGHTRTFLCPDGERRVFSWHSKIALEAWRIHFLTVPASRRVLIGYIGKHLPLPR